MTVVEAMKLAIQEAYKGAPHVSPNPLVGCVILNPQGELIQAGHHAVYGGPHAEVNALKGLTPEQLRGAHVIVTLEPCAHEGKTPSCAKALAKLPIQKVTYGLVDPNPLVAGQGADIIRAAGIQAEVFHDSDPAIDKEVKAQLEEVCEAFLKNFREKKIFIALKMATSLDGQVALKSGESQWITGPDSREHVQYLRSCYDAVLVGQNTVRHDNPSLNVRHPQIQKENKVIVLDPHMALLEKFSELKLSQVHRAENIFWCVAEANKEKVQELVGDLKAAPQICFVKKKSTGELDLDFLLQELWDKDIRSIMIEGGAFTASEFLKEGKIDRLLLFQAPILMGAGGAVSWTSTLRIASMQDKLVLARPQRQTFGQDLFITSRVNYPNK